MLDKIAMIAFLIIYILFLIATICTYLFIVGANENKADEERFFEDEEQMRYLSKNKKIN